MATKLGGFLVDRRRPTRQHQIKRRPVLKFPLERVAAYYTSERSNPFNERYMGSVKRVFASAQRYFGTDRCLTEIMPKDVRGYISMALDKRLKTESVSREIATLSAAAELYIRDKDLPILNPFYRARVPKKGHDSRTFVAIPPEQLTGFKTLCYQRDDYPRWILALLTDTGARSSEIVGASLQDFHLDDSLPYLAIEERPWRRLKTGHSRRSIPLAGVALWAARRVVATAQLGQVHAFPRYVKDNRLTSFWSTLNYWMRSRELPGGPHSLRHTFIDRLRDVDCPTDVRRRIMGWAGRTPEARYGVGPSLGVMANWIRRVATDEYLEFGNLANLPEASHERTVPTENARLVLAHVAALGSPTLNELRAQFRLGNKDLRRGLDYGRRVGAIDIIPPQGFESRRHFRYVITGRPIPDSPMGRAEAKPRSLLPGMSTSAGAGASANTASCFPQAIGTSVGSHLVSPRRSRLHCSQKAVPIFQWAMPSSTATNGTVQTSAERIFALLMPGAIHARTDILRLANLTATEYCRGRYHLQQLGVVERLSHDIDGQRLEAIRLTDKRWRKLSQPRAIARTKLAYIGADSDTDGCNFATSLRYATSG